MNLYKRDTKNWTVREVEGEPWPGKDSEGDDCYVNTHFENEQSAWESLKSEAEAFLSLSADRIEQAKIEIERAEKSAANAACALAKVLKTMPDFGKNRQG